MDRPGVRQVPEGSGEQGKMEKTGCKIICGAPMTHAVKELMMMMMMKDEVMQLYSQEAGLPLLNAAKFDDANLELRSTFTWMP